MLFVLPRRWPEQCISALWTHLLGKDCTLIEGNPPELIAHIVRVSSVSCSCEDFRLRLVAGATFFNVVTVDGIHGENRRTSRDDRSLKYSQRAKTKRDGIRLSALSQRLSNRQKKRKRKRDTWRCSI